MVWYHSLQLRNILLKGHPAHFTHVFYRSQGVWSRQHLKQQHFRAKLIHFTRIARVSGLVQKGQVN